MTWPDLPTALQGPIACLTKSWPGTLSLACEHLRTGERWRLNDVVMPAASLIKVPLAIAAYKAHETGKLNLNERVCVPPVATDTEAEFDNLGLAPPFTTSSWRKVVDRMLTESDNAATNALIERLGLDALEGLGRSLGWTQTRLQRLMLDGAAREAGRENWTTAIEMASVLSALARGQLVSPLHTRELLGLLAQQRSDDKLAAGFGPDRHFAHKTGELPGFRHDLGLVDGCDGWVVSALLGGPATDWMQADALLGELARILESYWQNQVSREQALTHFLRTQQQALVRDPRLAHDQLQLTWQQDAWCVTGVTTLPERLVMPDRTVRCEAILLQAVRAVVCVPLLQLRSVPGHHGELVSQLRLGDTVDVLQWDDDWVLLRGHDGYVSWGKRNNVTDGVSWSPTHQVVVPVITVRDQGGVVWQLGAMSRLRQVGSDTFALPRGQIVHLPADAVASLDGSGSVSGALAFAEAMLGLPYLWGGASGWGVDCSGLVQLAFASQGVWLPRDADQQETHTTPVSDRAALCPGDLLYFPGHVAIYTDNGRYIHASAKFGCVTINSLVSTDNCYEPKLADSLHAIGRTTLRHNVEQPFIGPSQPTSRR